jgi:hypothetical protein
MGGGRGPGRKRERTAGDKTQRGVIIAGVLLLIGAMVVSTVLASSVSGVADVSAAGVGVTAALLFFAAAAVGAAVGFLFELPRTRFSDRRVRFGCSLRRARGEELRDLLAGGRSDRDPLAGGGVRLRGARRRQLLGRDPRRLRAGGQRPGRRRRHVERR